MRIGGYFLLGGKYFVYTTSISRFCIPEQWMAVLYAIYTPSLPFEVRCESGIIWGIGRYFTNGCQPGAVLEILLSSFQAACLSRTCTVRSSRRVSSDAATKIFAKVSNFPSWWPKKSSSVHFLNFESKQRPLNTAIHPAVYASWNVVAEKGHTLRRGKILSGFWKPQKPI